VIVDPSSGSTTQSHSMSPLIGGSMVISPGPYSKSPHFSPSLFGSVKR
jgi:hypothetical protein